MRNQFPLFQSHLDLAHCYWSKIVAVGDTVIDATCGNGFDTLKLCQLALSNDKGKVHALDIQPDALEASKHILTNHLPENLTNRVDFHLQCHSTFPDSLNTGTIKLIVYNLGYLPGGNKAVTTKGNTTHQSLIKALPLITLGGAISITCYPGHEEGAQELEVVLNFAKELSAKEWSCCHHVWANRASAPSLLLIQKSLQPCDSTAKDDPPR